MTTSTTAARLTLTFTGTSIAVFGITPAANSHQAPAIVYYYLDGEILASQLIATGPTAQNGARFFRTPEMAAGSHRFSVEYRTSGAVNQPLSVDYFEVYGQGGNDLPQTSASSEQTPTPSRSQTSSGSSPSERSSTDVSTPGASSSTSGVSRSASLTASSEGPSQSVALLLPPPGMNSNHPSFSLYARVSSSGDLSPTGIASANERNGESSHPPLGPIIGGAVGGLALVALLILLTLYLRRRRRDKVQVKPLEPPHDVPDPGHIRDGDHSSSSSAPSTPTRTLSEPYPNEKASLTESLTDLTASPPSSHPPPSPLPSSNTVNAHSNHRFTMHSILSSRTAGTALPAYDPRHSTLTSVAGRSEMPPVYQV